MSVDPDPSDLSAADPVLDRNLADAVAAGTAAGAVHAKGGHHGHAPVHTHCENCGTALAGPFCHACGQHDFPFHQSFWHVVQDALENFFHFEGKFFRNVITLLFRPGELTAAFNRGQRVAQMPPFRLYLFVSVIFFVAFFPHRAPTPATAMTWNIAKAEATSHSAETVGSLVAGATPAAAPARAAPTGVGQKIEHLLERMVDEEFRQRVVGEFLHALPRLLLVALPLFALYTRVLFRGSGQVYLQHLVLALHYHTFVYLWLMLTDGWSGIAGLASGALGSGVDNLCGLWMTVYPVWMLRRLFGNSWVLTTVKAALLTAVYCFTLGAIFLAGFLLLIAFE